MSATSRKTARSILRAGNVTITTIMGMITAGLFVLFIGAYMDLAWASDTLVSGMVWMHEAPPIWGIGLIVMVLATTIIACCLESISNSYSFKR